MAIPVKLPVFEGPLDLLMHLIEKNKIDIYDIPIVEITDQYLEYVRQMDHEDMDVTSEFLVMAATLLDIKSRMLLPREKNEETGEEEGDPREELVQRLLEYKMYKYLSEELAVRREETGVRFFRAQKLPKEVRNYQPPIDYGDLLKGADLKSLEKVFGEVLRRKKSRRDPIRSGFGKIRREQVNMDTKTLYIRAYLQSHPQTDFRALLESQKSREEVIVTFLILLELMKTQKVHIVQDSIGGKILVEAGKLEEPEKTTDERSAESSGSDESVTDKSAADTSDTVGTAEETEAEQGEDSEERLSEEDQPFESADAGYAEYAESRTAETVSPLRALRALLARRSAEVTAPFRYVPHSEKQEEPVLLPENLSETAEAEDIPAKSREIRSPEETETLPATLSDVKEAEGLKEEPSETEAPKDLAEELSDVEVPSEAEDVEVLPAELSEAEEPSDIEELSEEEKAEVLAEELSEAEGGPLPEQHFSARLWHGRCPGHAPGFVPAGATSGAAHYRGFGSLRTADRSRYSSRALREQDRLSRLWARRRM